MGLEDILRAIEREAEEERSRIQADAQQEIDALIDRAREEATRIEEDVRRDGEKRDRADAERVLLRARAEALRRLRGSREAVYAQALERARSRLASIRATPAYLPMFRAMQEEALSAMREAEVVQVDPRDAALAEGLLPGSSLRLCIRPDIETWGGVVVRTQDGRGVRNTLEERLERAEPFLRPIVASVVPGMAPWDREAEG